MSRSRDGRRVSSCGSSYHHHDDCHDDKIIIVDSKECNCDLDICFNHKTRDLTVRVGNTTRVVQIPAVTRGDLFIEFNDGELQLRDSENRLISTEKLGLELDGYMLTLNGSTPVMLPKQNIGLDGSTLWITDGEAIDLSTIPPEDVSVFPLGDGSGFKVGVNGVVGKLSFTDGQVAAVWGVDSRGRLVKTPVSDLKTAQSLLLQGRLLSITGGNSVRLPEADVEFCGNNLIIDGQATDLGGISPDRLSLGLDSNGGFKVAVNNSSATLPAPIGEAKHLYGRDLSGALVRMEVEDLQPELRLMLDGCRLCIAGGNCVSLPRPHISVEGTTLLFNGKEVVNLAKIPPENVIVDIQKRRLIISVNGRQDIYEIKPGEVQQVVGFDCAGNLVYTCPDDLVYIEAEIEGNTLIINGVEVELPIPEVTLRGSTLTVNGVSINLSEIQPSELQLRTMRSADLDNLQVVVNGRTATVNIPQENPAGAIDRIWGTDPSGKLFWLPRSVIDAIPQLNPDINFSNGTLTLTVGNESDSVTFIVGSTIAAVLGMNSDGEPSAITVDDLANIINSQLVLPLSQSLSGSNLTVTVGNQSSTIDLASAIASATTNDLNLAGTQLTSTVNGVADSVDLTSAIADATSVDVDVNGSNIEVTVNGNTDQVDITSAIAAGTTNDLSLSGANLTSTVNGVADTVDLTEAITGVMNSATTNDLSISGTVLTSTVNGVSDSISLTPAITPTVSVQGSTLTVTVGGQSSSAQLPEYESPDTTPGITGRCGGITISIGDQTATLTFDETQTLSRVIVCDGENLRSISGQDFIAWLQSNGLFSGSNLSYDAATDTLTLALPGQTPQSVVIPGVTAVNHVISSAGSTVEVDSVSDSQSFTAQNDTSSLNRVLGFNSNGDPETYPYQEIVSEIVALANGNDQVLACNSFADATSLDTVFGCSDGTPSAIPFSSVFSGISLSKDADGNITLTTPAGTSTVEDADTDTYVTATSINLNSTGLSTAITNSDGSTVSAAQGINTGVITQYLGFDASGNPVVNTLPAAQGGLTWDRTGGVTHTDSDGNNQVVTIPTGTVADMLGYDANGQPVFEPMTRIPATVHREQAVSANAGAVTLSRNTVGTSMVAATVVDIASVVTVTGDAVTVTLPPLTADDIGVEVTVKQLGSWTGATTINAPGGGTIDGSNSGLNLNKNTQTSQPAVTLRYTGGNNWIIV